MADIVTGHPSYAGVRAVVLGAGGFIGAWVSRAMTESGADLTCVVRDLARSEGVLAARRVSSTVVERDLREPGAVEDLLETVRPSIVFNLAGYGVDHSERDELEAWRLNTDLVGRICRVLGSTRDPRWVGADLVQTGSAAEYGAADGELVENAEPHPVSAYGRTKLEGTRLLKSVCSELGVRAIVARPFNVYGPGEPEGRLLPTLLRAARSSEPASFTSGDQLRDFTFVGDVVEGVVRLGLAQRFPVGEVVNLATGRLLSVRRFVQVAASVLGIPDSQLRFGTLQTRADEFKHSVVSVDRLRDLLAWLPTVSLEEGIRLTDEIESGGVR
jgi:nucleoside-diphosphate-sugar epimerase